jgi:glycosyltransferase involved in cell wall biosynthesis
MPKITALLHTHNDGARIGRTLDSLRPCDEVLMIDSASDDDTQKIARDHGATVKLAIVGVEPGAYAIDTRHEWVLCLKPGEALSEALEASLREWQDTEPDPDTPGYTVSIRQNTAGTWKSAPSEMRLVNRNRVNWMEDVPPNAQRALPLQGDLLKFDD